MATTAPMPAQVSRQLATRTHGVRIALVFGLLVLLAGGVVWYLIRQRAVATPKTVAATTTTRLWVAPDGYSVPEKPVVVAAQPPITPPSATPLPVDRSADEATRQMRHEMAQLQQKLTALEARQAAATKGAGTTGTKPPVKRPAPMLYVSKEVQDTPAPSSAQDSKRPTYILAPWATKLPCTIEPLMNSDVPGVFTAKISTNVYDTETGRHLLVPQGATVGGHDQGQTLLYGNERLPTVALGLAIGARTYDLGQAPVMDQLGTNGLTGDVDNHFWRLAGAVLIGGALKGGQQVLQAELAQAGGAGAVAGGVASNANQATQQRVGRALDTRPTIRVFPGTMCHVLLTKPLTLPAVWQ